MPVILESVLVVEDGPVTSHPVSIGEEEQWSEPHHLKTISDELVVQSWRQSHAVRHDHSLAEPLVQKVEHSNWEQDGHADAVSQRDVDDVEYV